MTSADRIIREVSRMRRGPLAPDRVHPANAPDPNEVYSDNRLPGRTRDDLAAIARNFAASHTVDELMYLAGACEAEAQRKAEGRSRSGAG